MNIKTVSYERLRSFGNYQNEKIGITWPVEDDQTPDEVLETLKQWVNDKVAAAERQDAQVLEIADANDTVYRLNREAERLEGKCERLRNFLETFGVNISKYYDSDLPF